MVITTINPSEIVVMFTNLAILGAPHCINGGMIIFGHETCDFFDPVTW